MTPIARAITHDESVSESSGQSCAHGSHAVAHNNQGTQNDHDTDGQKPCENDGSPLQACAEAECSFDVPAKVKLVGAEIATAFAIIIEPAVSTAFQQRLSQPAPRFPLGAQSISNVRELLQAWLL